MLDVTDATFDAEVIQKSSEAPVIVDFWAPWCAPCKTLGPLLEKVVADADGEVVGVKVNVDENPQSSGAFSVQSIPAVYALKNGVVVDGFNGAQGEAALRDFVQRLVPSEQERAISALLELGDEQSLRSVIDLDPGHVLGTLALVELLLDADGQEEALKLLARLPESAETRRLGARARQGENHSGDDSVRLRELLTTVKTDDAARLEYLDLLELIGADDPEAVYWRKQLTAALF
ncbi:MAG: thioredoxin domain-containing protein [Acidimicrobiales bacterium]